MIDIEADPNTAAAQAAYIHVPFCRSKCAYCDFSSQSGRSEFIPAWYDSVQNEILETSRWLQSQGLARRALSTVFFGGGTPSLLEPGQIEGLLRLLRQTFGIEADAEITMEANPGSLQLDTAGGYAAAGVNRVSLGLQSTNPILLARLGRSHNAADFIRSVQDLATVGIERISADIMLGLPGQTLADLDETLDLVLKLPVRHVSYYSLSIEEGTPFFERYAHRPELLPDENLERLLYHHTMERLGKADIVPYEISNAAASGHVCRHNLVYWHAESYFGFGPAAHSYLAGVRRANTADLDEYIRIWRSRSTDIAEANLNPFRAVTEVTPIDENEKRKETMLLGLRLLEGVRFEDFRKKHHCDLDELFSAKLKQLQKRGLIERTDAGIRLSRNGLDLANQVFIDFI